LFEGTTILAVHKGTESAIGGDGQVTFGQIAVMKHKAIKIRTLYKGNVLAGFAGSVSDALTLFEKFEGKLEEYHGNLKRASVELAKEWRLDRLLRKLEALLIVMDKESILVISGSGEVIEPDDGICAIGSGGNYALAAARGLANFSNLSPKEIVEESLKIAASICVYTNDYITVKTLNS
jgi:ATP-dependent HslUV protease subunit HslV